METTSSVIIVDDNQDNLKVVSNILKSEGYRLALALNGENALKILQEIHIDLILLDVMMPGMNGFEVCKLIKADTRLRDIPVIFLSALNSTEDIIKAFHSGAVDYISKPFQAEEVKARVAAHVLIRKQKQELMKLNTDKDRFISILAHDLKNPFHTLLGYSELLFTNADNYEKNKIKSHAEVVHMSAKKIYSLLEMILSWARAQSGKIPFEPIEMNLALIFDSILEESNMLAQNKRIHVQNDLKEVYLVEADYNMITTILRNLISNAIKFSNAGSSVILNAQKKVNQVIISVADHGIGISSGKLSKLFQIDQIRSTSGTQNESGTGLGLIICKEFVEKHGGTIWAESIEGEGSTFRFSLPVKSA